ncbi:MAG TPA: hypothetical protein VE870_15295 [Bacteroidales bacterium]|nr:hypothetical protein [Bacteroidales bacterium]
MKTNIYSKITKTAVVMFFLVASAPAIFAQFAPTSSVTQTPIEERKGSESTYTVPGPIGDEYSWEVVGGVVTNPASGVTGSGTSADPYVVPFAAGQTAITVQWPDDDSTIVSTTGNVSVQRKVAHSTVQCPSQIQSLEVSFWSNPTIAIQDADYEMCSSDPTSGDITVAFTGAPNFDFKYTITDTDGNVGAEQTITGVTTATSTIGIPANLANSSSTVDQTYIVTITEMNDAFTGTGTIIDGTFTITVHPTIETGDITSNNSLTRR